MSAPDYRALLVRYMASVIEAEGISFICDSDLREDDEIQFSEDENELLRELEIEASALLDLNAEESEQVVRSIMPTWKVFLNGEEVKDVLSMGQDMDGSRWIEKYPADNFQLPAERTYGDFEFRMTAENDVFTVSAAGPIEENDIVKAAK